MSAQTAHIKPVKCPTCGAKLQWEQDFWDSKDPKFWLNAVRMNFSCGLVTVFHKDTGELEVTRECRNQK